MMRLPYPHTPWFLDGYADMPEKRDHPTRIRYKRPLARWSVKLWGSILRDKFGYTPLEKPDFNLIWLSRLQTMAQNRNLTGRHSRKLLMSGDDETRTRDLCRDRAA